MNVHGVQIPDIFIKVCSKLQYAEDIKNGKIFMNESGYFRKLDDAFRGDVSDGKRPVDLEDGKLSLESDLGKIDLTDMITLIQYGFPGDDKVPIFCCSVLDESVFEEPRNQNDGSVCLKVKTSFIEHMSQFGNHAVLFGAKEFIDKINGFLLEHKLGAKYRKVEYCELIKRYDIFDLFGEDDIFLLFFRKDIQYSIQNEWRIILVSDRETLINENEDHYTMDLGELMSAKIIEIPELGLVISENDE